MRRRRLPTAYCLLLTAYCLLSRYRTDERRDIRGVLALQQPRRHPVLPRSPDSDGAQYSRGGDLADAVEVRACDAAGVDGGEGVAGRAGGAEEGLAARYLGRGVLGLELRGGALGVGARGEDDRRHGDAHAEVDDQDRDLESAVPAGEICLACAPGAA